MIPFTLVDSCSALDALLLRFEKNRINTLAVDFEEESNLHVYGEHLCTIQIYDGTDYYLVDALEISKDKKGIIALKSFLESEITKIMFDCSSDAAIVRKTMGIHLKNVFDIRVIAMALGFSGNLSGLISRNLHIEEETDSRKKKYQRTNWMKRPLSDEQIEYALGDVAHLFTLKDSLEEEMARTLTTPEVRKVYSDMKACAVQKHKDKPGWEKICNYRKLTFRQKVFVRFFFNARDCLAKEANVPPTNILEKELIVDMVKAETWKGVLKDSKLQYAKAFENARLAALEELDSKSAKS